MQKEVRPVLAADLRDLLPSDTFVVGVENECRTHLASVGFRAEEVVRRNIVAVGENTERRRADVSLGTFGNVVDDDARRCRNIFLRALCGFFLRTSQASDDRKEEADRSISKRFIM